MNKKKSYKEILESLSVEDQKTITEREKQKTDSLQIQERRYKQLVENAAESITEIAADGRFLTMNPAAAKELGGKPKDFLGKKISDVLPEERANDHMNSLEMIIKTGQRHTWESEVEIQGEKKYYHSSSQPIKNSDDRVFSVLTLSTDITEKKKIEKALRESEERYRSFVRNIPGIAFRGNLNFVPAFFHGRVEEITGYKAEEFLAGNPRWDQIIYPDDLKQLMPEVQKMCSLPNLVSDVEHRIIHKNGEVKWVQQISNNVCDETGQVRYIDGIVYDITERKKAETLEKLAVDVLQELNNSKKKQVHIKNILDLMLKATGYDAIGIRLQEGKDFPYYETNGFSDEFVEAETSLCNKDLNLECMCGNVISGRTDPSMPYFTEKGSFWTNSTTELVGSMSKEELAGIRGRCNREGYESIALIPVRSDKEIIGLLQLNNKRKNTYDINTIRFFEGLAESVGIAFDAKKTQDALEQSQRKLNALFNGITDAVYLHHITEDGGPGKVIEVSDVACKMLGYSKEELLNMEIKDIDSSDSDVDVKAVVEELKTGKPIIFEQTHRHKDGHNIPVEVHAVTFDFAGEKAILSTARDITERKKAEAALRESEELFRSAFAQEYQFTVILDNKGNMVDFNDLCASVIKESKEHEIGLPFWEACWWEPSYVQMTREQTQRALEGEIQTAEVQYINKAGEIRDAIRTMSPIKDDSSKVKYISVSGIDIHEKKKAEAALRESEEKFRSYIENSRDGVFVVDKDGKYIDANPSACALVGYSRKEILQMSISDVVYKDHLPLALYEFKKLKRIGQMDSNLKFVRKDGSTVPISLRANALPGGRYIAFHRDESERIALEEHLRQSQKMEAIGKLAGGIAHDFNNLLTGILGYANLLKIGAEPKSETYERASVIEKSAERAADLTKKLLGFARKGKYENKPVDLTEAVHEVTGLLRRTINKKITIAEKFNPGNHTTIGDPTQINQVLMNLAVNARDAMSDGGNLEFEISRIDKDDEFIEKHPRLEKKDYVCVSVRDSGPGIPEDLQNKIFEPFFTTKEGGTGMGLATVYGIMMNHNGDIRLTSRVGETNFEVYFPSEDIKPILEEKKEEGLRKGKGKILVIDDELMIRSLVKNVLSGLEYSVAVAENGEEGLKIYKQNKPDLVVLDMNMPVMDGPACYEKLKELDPEVNVVVLTGYAAQDSAQTLSKDIEYFIQKPCTAGTISSVVAKALKRR